MSSLIPLPNPHHSPSSNNSDKVEDKGSLDRRRRFLQRSEDNETTDLTDSEDDSNSEDSDESVTPCHSKNSCQRERDRAGCEGDGESEASEDDNHSGSSASSGTKKFSKKCLDFPLLKLGQTRERKEKRKVIRTNLRFPRKSGACTYLRRIRLSILNMAVFASKYHKEICAVFFIIASGLAALKSGPPKTRSVPRPSPFFSPSAIKGVLHDNYNGEYVDLARHVIPSFPTFIFYYAPWDSESVAVKAQFLKLAKHFQGTHPNLVKFYAVNCWWLDGQCRQNYKNLSHYPILVVHVASYLGVIYNGPLRAELMSRFINSALKPFTRLDTEEELWRFRAQHDTVVLAYFNFTEPGANHAYETYRQMALRNLEADPFGQVGFGLFLKSDLAGKYFLTSSNAISLMLFNEIHTAKWVGSYHEKGMKGPVGQVADWILERTKSIPVTWVYPLRNGFSNRPVALGHSDISQELWKGPVFLLVTKRYYPSAYSPFYSQLKEVALDYFNCNRSGNVTKLRQTTHKISAEWKNLWKSLHRVCRMSKVRTTNCDIMWEQLSDWEEKKSAFKPVSLSHYENVSQSLNFTGLSCDSDRPFRFLVVDPTDIPYFVELALGQKSGKSDWFKGSKNVDPVAFIIDAENEILLPFTSFNISDIAREIHNFTLQVESGEHFPLNRLWNDHPSSSSNVASQSQSTIRKFNSEELLDFLDSPDSPLFLMYTAKFCGYCGVMLSHFARLENFLGNYNVNVTLAKIDSFRNSLPERLSPENIPSFVFYPADKNADKRQFPKDESMTTQSLLRFLLSELDSQTRVTLSLQTETCKKAGNISRDKCLNQNRERVTEQIHSVLKRLRQGLGFNKRSEEPNFELNSDSEHLSDEIDKTFFSQSMQQWRNELLDHLRAVKLSLDVA